MDAKIYSELQSAFYSILKNKLKDIGYVAGTYSLVDFDEICIVLIK